MTFKKEAKNVLMDLLPHGYVATRSWLHSSGVGSHRIDNLVKSEQIVAVAAGVYRSPETRVTWEGVVASLQRMGIDVHVGGQTALDLHGYSHYVAMGNSQRLYLYSAGQLPTWLPKVLPDINIQRRRTTRFFSRSHDENPALYRKLASAKHPSFPLTSSVPELALLEALHGVPDDLSFEHADLLLEGLTTLSPKKLDQALQACANIKAKRLFFWFAQRHKHPWYKILNQDKYDLGSGKRVIAKSGKLDRDFSITVPKEMHEES